MRLDEFTPAAESIDIWRIPLNLPANLIETYHTRLDEKERVRAQRLKVPEKRNQFIITRSVLKTILAQILGKQSEHVRIGYTEQGKPCIKEPYQDKTIHFNVSHSATQAIIALTLSQELGVDIEKITANTDYTGLSRRFFSIQEQAELDKLKAVDLARSFYTCWVRKEAFVKAVGNGLRYGLDNFNVSIEPEIILSQIHLHKKQENHSSWFNISVECEPGYVAALAIADPGISLRYRTITF